MGPSRPPNPGLHTPDTVAEAERYRRKKTDLERSVLAVGKQCLLGGRGSSGSGGGSSICSSLGCVHSNGSRFNGSGSSLSRSSSGSLGSRSLSRCSRSSHFGWCWCWCWCRSGLNRSGYRCGSRSGLFFFAAGGQRSSSDHGSQDEGLVHCSFPKVGGTDS